VSLSSTNHKESPRPPAYSRYDKEEELERDAITKQAEEDIQAMIEGMASDEQATSSPIRTGLDLESAKHKPITQEASPSEKVRSPPKRGVVVPPLNLDRAKARLPDVAIVREAMGRRQLDSMQEGTRGAVVSTKRGMVGLGSPEKSISPGKPGTSTDPGTATRL